MRQSIAHDPLKKVDLFDCLVVEPSLVMILAMRRAGARHEAKDDASILGSLRITTFHCLFVA